MTKKRLFVDMDGTLARFHDQVNYLERMFEKDFFRNLEPFENMVAGLRQFMKDHPEVEVYILSAKVLGEPPYCEAEKNAWLDLHLPEIDRDHRIFTDPGLSKADYIPGIVTKDDYLIDDYNRGLNLFLHGGGRAIKCHNNINQRGLGQHGGSAGHLWMGPMVHTSDTPAMIAAELAQHMGLTYQLEDVLNAYPDIAYQNKESYHQDYSPMHTKHIKQISSNRYFAVDTSFSDPLLRGFSSSLNAIRFLSGNDDFREYLLETSDRKELSATAQELRAVCFNVYQNPDYTRYLRADRVQLADDVLDARAAADQPIIGQICFLNTDGTVAYSRMFLQQEEMQAEIDSCRDIGEPITEEWFIPRPPVSLHALCDYNELADRLFYEYGFTEKEAANTASALLMPYQDRTSEQMLDLTAAWHDHEIPGSLRTFLRLTDQEMQDYVSPSKAHPSDADLSQLLSGHEISNVMPFSHDPGNRAEEGALLSAIGDALEEDFVCLTADVDGEPFVFFVSPDIRNSALLWSDARMQSWAALRFDAFCSDPSGSPLRLYLDNTSDESFHAVVYAALPASTPPELAVRSLECFQSGFGKYFHSFSVSELDAFEQDYVAMQALAADVIEHLGAYKLSKIEKQWLMTDIDNIVCDALLAYSRYQNAGHKADPPEVQQIDKRRICSEQVTKTLSQLREQTTIAYPDGKGGEVSYALSKGDLLLAVRKFCGYTPLKNANKQALLPADAKRIHFAHKKPSLRSVIQNADDRTAGKAGNNRPADPER